MNRLKNVLHLFAIMFKIGLFTFGGGYAMLALLENEFVEKKKYIDKDEFLDMVAIAESTPGPIAINCATYLGYKHLGFFGSLMAMSPMVLIPDFSSRSEVDFPTKIMSRAGRGHRISRKFSRVISVVASGFL